MKPCYPTMMNVGMAGQLHVKYYSHLNDNKAIGVSMSTKWPGNGQLFPETEGFVTVIQDQVLVSG